MTTELAYTNTDTYIPEGYVALDYKNDPETEDLIFGSELQEGMVVLIEATTLRDNPEGANLDSPYTRHRLDQNSRWCKITKLLRNSIHSSEVVTFIGVYADGTKMSRTFAVGNCWFVKIPVDLIIAS